MNLVDLLIILLLLLAVINGYRRGFIASLVGIAGSLIGLFTAYRYYPHLTAWADERFGLKEIFSGYFNENLILPQAVSRFKLESLGLTKIGDLGAYLDKVELPEALRAQITLYLEKLQDTLALPASMSLGDIIHQFLATIILNALAFIIIWSCVAMLINVLATLLTKIMKGTVLGGANRLGGIALGLALRVFTLTILLGLLSPLFNLAELAEGTIFASIVTTINEAKTVPYFIDLYAVISERIVDLLLL